MTERPIRFHHRGRIVEVADADPTRTVLDWLREDARCTGTKEGCAEGDCGACTVAIGRLDARGDLQLQTVNACIQFLPSLDGKALFTVEDLSAPGAPLHPVQQALVDCHGSQCGFCTPGIAMTLWFTRERSLAAGAAPSRQDLADALAGNLCRCTGYRPILDAGERACAIGGARLDAAAVQADLRSLAVDLPLAYRQRWFAPRSVAELAALRAARPDARLIAGATDIGLWVNKQFRDLPELIAVGEVPELARVADGPGGLHIGAAASLEAAWAALAERWPQLQELWLRFASPPVRHAGTMGGNLANGSPIGDSAPVLMALDAQVQLQRLDRVRTLPLADFYTGYMSNRLERGEFLRGVVVPPGPVAPIARALRAYKVSKRFDSDISALCAGLSIDLEGDRVVAARIAFGGMAATVQRASQAEAALVGRPWSEDSLAAAVAALESDYAPLTDLRASAAYRMQVARNLLRRFWLETRPGSALSEAQTSVWARTPQEAA